MHGEEWAPAKGHGVYFKRIGEGSNPSSYVWVSPIPSRAILNEAQPPKSQLPCWKGILTEGLNWWQVALERVDVFGL